MDIESPVFLGVVGAFAGAVFAFLFMRLNEVLTNIGERHKRHYNALVSISHSLNTFLDRVHTHAGSMRHLANTYESVKPPRMALTFNLPQPLEVDESQIINLLNTDLINDIYTFIRKVERVNIDTASIRDAYRSMLDRALSGEIDTESYVDVCRQNAPVCREIAKFSDRLISETIDIVAKTRVRMSEDRPWLLFLNYFAMRRNYEEGFGVMVDRERAIMFDEIKEVGDEADLYIEEVKSEKKKKMGRESI